MVEDKWYSLLLSHIESLYLNHHLPSHDVGHHQRVWGYVKELLEEIDSKGIEVSNQLIEQAIVASFFHDTGLLLDKSEVHGYKSRLLCEEFFRENPNYNVFGFEEVLYAIEHHDDKSIKTYADKEIKSKSIELLPLISTADDLDAFGLVGVFRYIEIYALRGFSLDKIPSRVIENLINRFNSFQLHFSFIDDYVAKQSPRFLMTKQFFQELDQEVNSDYFLKCDLKIIAEQLVKGFLDEKLDVKSVIDYGITNSQSLKGINFFTGLKDELNL